jgi:hypothetical protein
MPPLPCMLVCAFLSANCTRDRGCSVHPAFPAPLLFVEGESLSKARAHFSRENAVAYPLAV